MNSLDGVVDWQTVWLIPCLMAAAIAVIFFVFFRDKPKANSETGHDESLPS